MIVLGVDPGLANLGYGVVRTDKNGTVTYVTSGVIVTGKTATYPRRIEAVFNSLMALTGEHVPHVIASERFPPYAKVGSAAQIHAVCGVLALISSIRNCDFVEYSPTAVKQLIAGTGKAEKAEVIEGIVDILGLDPVTRIRNHAADALGVAITHASHAAKAHA